jgi:probable HAF family extracellular repeat protein
LLRLTAYLFLCFAAACNRDAIRVEIPVAARIEIQEVSLIGLGQTVALTATAYDSAGADIPNAQLSWISRDTMSLHLTPNGSATGRNWSKKTWIVAQHGNARDSIAIMTAVTYNVSDIGTLGGPEAEALAMSGDYIVGWSTTSAGERHAFRWQRGGPMTDLGTLGGTSSTAYDVNAAGVVAGEAELSGPAPRPTHAFVFRNGSMTDLGTFGGTNSAAYAIDAGGTRIVGTADSVRSNCANVIVCSEFAISAAALWVNDVARVLPVFWPNPYAVLNSTPPGGRANDISGEKIVGTHNGAAVSWDLNGTAQMIALPFFQPGTPRVDRRATAWRVAADGAILGWDRTTSAVAATLVEGWVVTGAGRRNLNEQGNDESMRPLGVNAAGDIVGESGTNNLAPSCDCGSIWKGSSRFDLTHLTTTTLRITVAHAIDDRGNIIATGVTPDGRKRALLLEPRN